MKREMQEAWEEYEKEVEEDLKELQALEADLWGDDDA